MTSLPIECSGVLPHDSHSLGFPFLAATSPHYTYETTRDRCQLPRGITEAVTMLLVDQRFGREQLLLTADALRAAAAESFLGGSRGEGKALLRQAWALENEAPHRKLETIWS